MLAWETAHRADHAGHHLHRRQPLAKLALRSAYWFAVEMMARLYVFADEAGNFDFSHKGSKYFVLTTIAVTDCSVGDALLNLRRDMAWRGMSLQGEFHATEDLQAVRNEVFATIRSHDVRIDATILEKAKALPHVRSDDQTFYLHAWYYHIQHVAPRIAVPGDELLVIGASWATRKKQAVIATALGEVIGRSAPSLRATVHCWSAASEPCLQVADYCCWAIGRKWERGDTRSYDLIKDTIASEFDLFGTASRRDGAGSERRAR